MRHGIRSIYRWWRAILRVSISVLPIDSSRAPIWWHMQWLPISQRWHPTNPIGFRRYVPWYSSNTDPFAANPFCVNWKLSKLGTKQLNTNWNNWTKLTWEWLNFYASDWSIKNGITNLCAHFCWTDWQSFINSYNVISFIQLKFAERFDSKKRAKKTSQITSGISI